MGPDRSPTPCAARPAGRRRWPGAPVGRGGGADHGKQQRGAGERQRIVRAEPVDQEHRQRLRTSAASASPITRPVVTSTAASATTRRTTEAAGAPSAMRTPISFVRRVTE